MQLQVNYQCDICSKFFLLDFKRAISDKELKCSNCGVMYKFTEEELEEFNQCYMKLVERLKDTSEKSNNLGK